MTKHPISGNALLLASAKASVAPNRLPVLLSEVQSFLAPRLDEYRHAYECVHEDEVTAIFFVEAGHWQLLGEELGLAQREWKAARRAHNEHLRMTGTDLDRRDEFETALEIREPVVIGLV